ncbi:MAG: STAS domain-containing protein [Planctomycetaceae bacterium]|nr:STAS domain-containing protein [Planctomycetaceae bacterium]
MIERCVLSACLRFAGFFFSLSMTQKLLHFLSGVFRPQLFSIYHDGYSWRTFFNDLVAGIIVGIVALPLAIAFGVASLGSGTESVRAGLYTAIIAGFIISLLGGSNVQIGGPTGAFIVIVFGIVSEQGIEGLICATILAGIILVLMGLTGMGTLIKYIPYPVTLGFTSGIAVVIAVSQVQMFFGINLEGEKLPGEFVDKIIMLASHGGTINWYACGLSVLTVIIVFATPLFVTRIPGSLVAVVVGTLLVYVLHLPVDTIGQPYGGERISLDLGLPVFTMPVVNWSNANAIVRAAITIALLGAIESLLSAVVADSMTGTRHRSNTELIAQGIANIVTPFFGGIPSTGAIARTATNIRNGGRTPIAGMIHAVVLLLIVLLFGNYAAAIPMPVLAGILISVAINMSQYPVFIRMFRAPKSDIAVMMITFLLTVFLDLTIAIPVGLILACFMFMHRMEQMFTTGNISNRLFNISDADPDEDKTTLQLFDIPDGVRAYDLNGPFFFGTIGKFQGAIDDKAVRVLVLRMRGVPAMDISGLHAFEELLSRAQEGNTTILFSGIRPQPLSVIKRFGLWERIGDPNVHNTLTEAIYHAAEIVENEMQSGEFYFTADSYKSSVFLPTV